MKELIHVPPSLLEELESARRVLKSTDKPIVIWADTDADGVTSAAMLERLLRDVSKDVEVRIVERDKVRPEEDAFNVILDIAPEAYIPFRGEGMVIDHHPPRFDPKGWIVVNPHHHETPVPNHKYNTSLLVYLLTGGDELRALIGHVGDKAEDKHTEEWVKRVMEKYGVNKDDVIRAVTAISLVDYDRSADPREIYHIVSRASHIRDIVEHPYVKPGLEGVEREIERYVEEVGKQRGPVVVVRIDSPYFIKSPVSTVASLRNPEKVIIVGQEEDGYINYSLRHGNYEKTGVHLGEIAREAARSFGGIGGGHPPAAGLKIPKENAEAFENWVREKLHSLFESINETL